MGILLLLKKENKINLIFESKFIYNRGRRDATKQYSNLFRVFKKISNSFI